MYLSVDEMSRFEHEGNAYREMGERVALTKRDYSFRTENRQSVYPAGCNASCRFYILENKKCPPAVCTRILSACYATREPKLVVPFLPGTCSAKNHYLHFFVSNIFYQSPQISQPLFSILKN